METLYRDLKQQVTFEGIIAYEKRFVGFQLPLRHCTETIDCLPKNVSGRYAADDDEKMPVSRGSCFIYSGPARKRFVTRRRDERACALFQLRHGRPTHVKMNLMFRKNFKEQKCGTGKSLGGKSSASRHASKRSNREQGYTPIEEHHYRTHLFFSPPRCSYGADNEEGQLPTVSFALLTPLTSHTLSPPPLTPLGPPHNDT